MSARNAYPAFQPMDRLGSRRFVPACEGCGRPWHKRFSRFKLTRLFIDGVPSLHWLCRFCRLAVQSVAGAFTSKIDPPNAVVDKVVEATYEKENENGRRE